MKSIRFVLFIALFGAALSVAAQPETPITQGSIQVLSDPYTVAAPKINLRFSFSQNINAGITSTGPIGGSALPFTSNQAMSGFTYTLAAPPTAQGTLDTCIGWLAHPDQPLSTQLTIKLGDFRIPNFPKAPWNPNQIVEIIVPFTMTGRISCLGDTGGISRTNQVSGEGRARLRFKRVDTFYWRRVYLTDAFYGFGTSAPALEETAVKTSPDEPTNAGALPWIPDNGVF
jgi:hypothetical protein